MSDPSAPLPAYLPPCAGCGAHHYDPGRFFPLLGLCVWCFGRGSEADHEYQAARDVYRVLRPPPAKRPAPFPCHHKPGSAGRIDAMRWRAEHNYALHHPDDAPHDPAPDDGDPPGPDPVPDVVVDAPVKDAPDPIAPADQLEGVEMDRSKGRLAWRARPRWRDCRVKCGRFPTYHQAAEAVKEFYRQRWGCWDETRPWLRMAACLAVVRLAGGEWCDLEFRDFAEYPAGVQRTAAGRVVRAEPYAGFWAAERALSRELARR
jgi:hypothetical protein